MKRTITRRRITLVTVLTLAMSAALSIAVIQQASADACPDRWLCIYDAEGTQGNHYFTQLLNMSHTNIDLDNGDPLRNNAESVDNKTNCDVRIIDDRGWFPDDWQDIAHKTSADLISSVDDENDRHERRTCHQELLAGS